MFFYLLESAFIYIFQTGSLIPNVDYLNCLVIDFDEIKFLKFCSVSRANFLVSFCLWIGRNTLILQESVVNETAGVDHLFNSECVDIPFPLRHGLHTHRAQAYATQNPTHRSGTDRLTR